MTNREHEDDIILHVIVIISIFIEILIDALKCLISLGSKNSIPAPGNSGVHSTVTTSTKSGKAKSQPRSRSTKPISVTEDQKKAAGGIPKAGPSKRSASSPRSKQSKPTSSTRTRTKSGTSQALGFQPREQTTTSTTPTTTLRSTPNPNHTTADQSNDCNLDATNWIEYQPTEPLHVLPQSQEEVQEHTVLCTKVSKHALKD